MPPRKLKPAPTMPVDVPENERAVIGSNSGGSLADLENVLASYGKLLADTPVIEDHETLTKIATAIANVKAAMKAAETERDGRVRPLNEQVKEINGLYTPHSTVAKRAIGEGNDRMTAYARAEEAKRQEAAREAARRVAEAEAAARAAEEAEREVAENAKEGEIGIDVVEATRAADAAFSEFKAADKASRFAAKDSVVRTHTGVKATSMRNVEYLDITGLNSALGVLNEEEREPIRDAVRTAARAYRKRMGALPPGITARIEKEFR